MFAVVLGRTCPLADQHAHGVLADNDDLLPFLDPIATLRFRWKPFLAHMDHAGRFKRSGGGAYHADQRVVVLGDGGLCLFIPAA